ncbi:DHA2 family efflux MFS transporter permease subunit [Streptomyces sp. NPDC053560]|uniref:DHA2 family efflux MFS transporter permease subunit n=1 Tax=Streptomyces sp. NPDC053560 TaxID=3365711 RepID=UPI0037D7653B
MIEPANAEGADSPRGSSPARAPVLIAVLVVSAFVMILNETILSVALRDLTVDLGISTTTVQWLTSGFLLTMAVIIPITGFLLERFTARQVFLASLTMFSVGTLVSGLAPGFGVLMAGRVIQACGTAVMLPLLMTSVMRLVPPAKRGATMGTISIVIAVAPAVGPTVGGAVLASLGWRWMFWIVLPLAVAALATGAVLMRLNSETRQVPLDVLSVVLSAIGFGGVLYGLASVGESGGGAHTLPPWIPIVVGLLSLGLFVARQLRLQRDDRALLDLRPFKTRPFSVALVLSALLFMCLLGVGSIMLPLYLQTVLRTSTFVSGLAVLPGGLLLGLLGRPVGRLFDRFGARPLVIPGALALAVSLWLFTLLGAHSPLAAVIAIHILLMAGLGLMMTPLMTESLGALPDHLYSHGSAILSTLQQVAGAFGTAVFVTVASLSTSDPSGAPDAGGLRTAFMVAGVIGLLAFATSLLVSRTARPAHQDHAPAAEGTVETDGTMETDGTIEAEKEAAAAGTAPVRKPAPTRLDK